MTQILLDTDVILDFFLERKPFSQDSVKILSLAENKKIKVYVTSLSFSNCYYILKQIGSRETVIDNLRKLARISEIMSVNSKSVELALYSEFRDFEDALQYFSAYQKDKINVIITRNIKDYKKSELPVMTPENYLKSYKDTIASA
ncbi:MAG: DNA-binding protein [Bacteroidetes bacterium CG02_land_8_20_14_3_00_31_25]|nr:MAG: DNA-binding protein [Bacteroidetes bacterium CG02_land_8_20_14_3_00_31_25]